MNFWGQIFFEKCQGVGQLSYQVPGPGFQYKQGPVFVYLGSCIWGQTLKCEKINNSFVF